MPENVEAVEFLKELLLSMRNDPIQHDTVFIVNGVRFPMQKNLAAAASPVLRTMFTSGTKESAQSEVTLHNLEADVWRRVDTYIYKGTIQFDSIDDALDILECLTRFQIQRLRQLTLNYLGDLLNEENCIRLLHTADKYNASELYESAMNRIVKSLHSLAGGVEFAKLEPHLLEALFQRSNFDASTLASFTGLMNWLLHNKERDIDEKNEDETIEQQICVLSSEMMRDEAMKVQEISPASALCGITQSHSKLVESFSVAKMPDNDLKVAVRFCRKLSLEVSSRYSRKTPVIDALFEKCFNKLVQSGQWSDFKPRKRLKVRNKKPACMSRLLSYSY